MSNNRYSNPIGYTFSALSVLRGAAKYVPNNGFISAPYSPNWPGTQRVSITFSAAPANGSGIAVQDIVNGVVVNKTFVFTYSGSPGPGIIPLVAGGGTAAQCAVATALAFNQQLNTWVSDGTSVANRVLMASTVPGRNVGVPFAGTQATGTFASNPAQLGNALPACIGGRPATLPSVDLA